MSFPISIIPREKFSDYPFLNRLLELHDIPEQIYVVGKIPNVTIDEYGRATPRVLTIVGTRKHSNYGKNAVEKLVETLNGEEVIIISGLAYGIDSLAHISALKNNLKTIAILGNGLDKKVMYPGRHLYLAEEIVAAGGTLLSELPPTTKAAQWTFPARNRIVAALSDAVLLIEAEEKSGTLITARLALELGRDIGAVPGEIFSPTSIGTNNLIREGAYTIGNGDDLFALLHLTKNSSLSKNKEMNYSKEENQLLDILNEPTEKDILLIKSKMPPDKFLMTISSLEMKGAINETFGEVRRIV